jgi:hypothetical protein
MKKFHGCSWSSFASCASNPNAPIQRLKSFSWAKFEFLQIIDFHSACPIMDRTLGRYSYFSAGRQSLQPSDNIYSVHVKGIIFFYKFLWHWIVTIYPEFCVRDSVCLLLEYN